MSKEVLTKEPDSMSPSIARANGRYLAKDHIIRHTESLLGETNRKHNTRIGHLIAAVIATTNHQVFHDSTIQRAKTLRQLSELGANSKALTRFVAKIYHNPTTDPSFFIRLVLTPDKSHRSLLRDVIPPKPTRNLTSITGGSIVFDKPPLVASKA